MSQEINLQKMRIIKEIMEIEKFNIIRHNREYTLIR